MAEHGESVDGDEDFTLSTADQVLGRLVVGWRGSALGRRDRDVLADVVPHVTLAVGLVRLTSDLRRSRLAVVTAQEEERRRLRRDLHDGVGPTLTGVSLALHTVVLDGPTARAPTPTMSRCSPSWPTRWTALSTTSNASCVTFVRPRWTTRAWPPRSPSSPGRSTV